MNSNKSQSDKFLSSCVIHIIDLNIIRARVNVFETQILRFGGRLVKQKPSTGDEVTHVLVDDELSDETIGGMIWSQTPELFREKSIQSPKIVRTKWLSGCIKQKKLIDSSSFEVKLPSNDRMDGNDGSNKIQKLDSPMDKFRKRGSSSGSVSETSGPLAKSKKLEMPKDVYDQTTESEISNEDDHLKTLIDRDGSLSPVETKPSRDDWDQSSGERVDYNKEITDKLQVLADGYKCTKDKWRALSYEKAIESLQRLRKPVSSYEEVRSMRGIGQSLADKIWEIHECGTLRKADAFLHDEKIRTLGLFSNVHGAGPTVALQWYSQGLRTLNDVLEKGNPTDPQRLGVKYYDEFLMKMDRSEASEIIAVVGKALKEIDSGFIYEPCGSYRRGRPSCGDVDILFTHPDGQSHIGVLGPLVRNLTETGFLTDHLVDCDEGWCQKKYMGVCKLKGEDKKHRRIDIVSFSYQEFPTAVVAWTGSSYFLRQLYSKAKAKGMRMNAHGLWGGVMRQGDEKVSEGYLIPTPTEESVFEQIGVPYRKPEERDTIFTDL